MSNSNDSGRAVAALVEKVARNNELSSEGVNALLHSLKSGGYSMAQFNHPDLGGMGQWSGGGMIMIGDFSNSSLKERVGKACAELLAGIKDSGIQSDQSLVAPDQSSSRQEHEEKPFKAFPAGQNSWWPWTFGAVSSSGSQNQSDYAYSSSAHKLAIRRNGRVTIYDTGAHEIYGVSQEQGSSNSLVFESQLGKVTEADLTPTD